MLSIASFNLNLNFLKCLHTIANLEDRDGLSNVGISSSSDGNQTSAKPNPRMMGFGLEGRDIGLGLGFGSRAHSIMGFGLWVRMRAHLWGLRRPSTSNQRSSQVCRHSLQCWTYITTYVYRSIGICVSAIRSTRKVAGGTTRVSWSRFWGAFQPPNRCPRSKKSGLQVRMLEAVFDMNELMELIPLRRYRLHSITSPSNPVLGS